jgi:hypothetical protein
MNHADIETTMRYAHVLDEDVSKAVATLAKSRVRKVVGKSSHNSAHSAQPTTKKPLRRKR